MEVKNNVVELNLDDIMPNRFQPRIKFNEDAINELASSIKEHGVIQPIVVRSLGDKYEIIAGERRYKASLLAGKQTIPAIIMELNDKDSAEVALLENVQRKDLTPIEEAISYKKILDMGNLTQDKLADKLGKNQSTVANKLRLLNLSDEVQEALLDDKISERHARSLLRIRDYKMQNELLNQIINERLTVRSTDQRIKDILTGKNTNDQLVEAKSNLTEKEVDEKVQPIFNTNLNESESLISQPVDMESKDNKYEFSNIDLDIRKGEKIMNNDFYNFNIPATPVEEETNVETPVSTEGVEEPTDNTSRPGQNRFFNIFNNLGQQKNENFVNDLEKKQVNMNFTPDLMVDNSINTPVENEINPSISDLSFDFNVPSNDNVVNETPVETSMPSFNFDSLNETINNESTVPVETPIFDFSSINNVETSPAFDSESINTVQPNNLELLDFNFDIKESPAEEFSISPIGEEAIPQNNFEDETDEGGSNFNIMGGAATIAEDNSPIFKQENKYLAGDLKTVINTIRECSKTIEKYGFEIDVEEIDLTDKYQVIFNIDKK